MNCKYCGGELTGNKPFCPSCGKNNTAEEANPKGVKAKISKMALYVTIVVVVLDLIIALFIGVASGKQPEIDESVEANIITEPEVEYTTPADTLADDVTCLGTYTVSDYDVLAAANTVIATLGDAELTVAELQIYYWTEVRDFLSVYNYDTSQVGLDLSVGLDQQMCAFTETEMTWQHYFLERALRAWRYYQAMSLEANVNNYILDQEISDYLTAVPAELEALAERYGMTRPEETLVSRYGPGITVDAYVDGMYTLHYGGRYYDEICENLRFTKDEVVAYFEENAATYEENGVTRDSGIYVDVRNILIKPETTGTDDSGVEISTDEDWEAAAAKAQKVLDLWLAGEKTEISFAELAVEYSEDVDSAENGGLYENISVGQTEEFFENWCFDEGRKTGDYSIVKTNEGYQIMFFVGSADIWFRTAESDMVDAAMERTVYDIMAKYEMDVDFASIKLGFLDLAS